MAEELDGLNATFERIKIPSAGSTVFELPGEDADEPDTVKEFSDVILHHHPLFAYYHDKYTGGSNPPDCGSFDGALARATPAAAAPSVHTTNLARARTAPRPAKTAAVFISCAKARYSRSCCHCQQAP